MNEQIPRTPFSTPLSGSAREVELRLKHIFSGPKKRPPVLFLALMFAVCVLCGNLVSCHVAESAAANNSAQPDSSQVSPDASAQRAPDTEIREFQEQLDNVDLDGDGLADTVTVTARYDPLSYSEDSISVTLTAALGNGTQLEQQWTEDDYLDIWSFQAARLTDPSRDSLVLELDYINSTYGAAEVRILELSDGELTECFRTNSDELPFVFGAGLEPREDSPLSALRIPVLVDKWHDPEFYTLTWNGTGWDLVGDGFFTDTETITDTNGRELTLAFRGRVTGADSWPHLVYDQIELYDGSTLLQTILPSDVPSDDRFPEQIFLADTPFYTILVQDINFDGAEDFAVPCDETKNEGRRWFRWNEGLGQFEYAFSLAGEPILASESQKVIEKCYADDFDTIIYNIYGFNNRGWLILEGTQSAPPDIH